MKRIFLDGSGQLKDIFRNFDLEDLFIVHKGLSKKNKSLSDRLFEKEIRRRIKIGDLSDLSYLITVTKNLDICEYSQTPLE
ncbi:MAG: hypothetical protein JXA99_04680 [Candidatus Lokiarchaeota archaeon]|nr:hypothetical protein [Candidatus Lokiarchaeota archaeon]